MDGTGITQREKDDHAQRAVFSKEISPRGSHSKESAQTDSLDLAMRSLVQTSIDQLYKNIYDIPSSNESPTGLSTVSSARESRIDSELFNLVGGYSTGMNKDDDGDDSQRPPHQGNGFTDQGSSTAQKPDVVRRHRNSERNWRKKGTKTIKPNLFESIHRATEGAENGDEKLELAMCLHILAAGYYQRGEYSSAITILKHSITIPLNHSASKFSAHMLLGEIYQTLGEMENSMESYEKGMEIQRRELGERDARFGTTCRHVAAAHFQALRIEEAEKLCGTALEIHRGNSDEEEEVAEDRTLMGLICGSAEKREVSIEHYVLAGIAMTANGNDRDLANIDCSIGDAHMELSRFDEAGRAYHRALSRLKSRTKGNRATLASIHTRMAGLCHRTGRSREAREYCENVIGMCRSRFRGIAVEEIAAVLLDLSSVLQSMDDLDRALELLQIAREIYLDRGGGGESSLIACVEARIGVVHYMLGNYSDSCNFLKSAIDKLRKMEGTPISPTTTKKKKPALLGIVLNQLGMACLQRNAINEALESFEEAKDVLETAHGIFHDQTLAVYSNLAATYDVIGRIGDAIALLGHVVGVGEERQGTANEEVARQRRRLSELEEENKRVPTLKPKSLNTLPRMDKIQVL